MLQPAPNLVLSCAWAARKLRAGVSGGSDLFEEFRCQVVALAQFRRRGWNHNLSKSKRHAETADANTQRSKEKPPLTCASC